MSKIEIGRTYVTRDGSRVKFQAIEDGTSTTSPHGGVAEQVYVAEVLGQHYKSVTRYKLDGTPLYGTEGMYLVDLVNDAGDLDSAKAIGSSSYKKKSAPGEGVAVLEQDADVALRDDDPVHPDAEDDPPVQARPIPPAPPRPTLRVQVNHAYEDAKGTRWVIEKQVGDRFASGSSTWSANGYFGAFGTPGPWDLVKDLGEVQLPTTQALPMPNEEGETPFNEGLVQAVLDGKTVQWRRSKNDNWEDLRNRSFAIRMLMLPGTPYQFRLKDQPIPRFCAIYKDGRISISYERYESVPDAGWGVVTVLRILLDPETMQVVSYKHLAPRPKGGVLS